VNLPTFLRHLIPWRMLYWIDRLFPVCWLNVAMWKMWGVEGCFGPSSNCWDGPAGEKYDYCGKFKTKEEFDKAMEWWEGKNIGQGQKGRD